MFKPGQTVVSPTGTGTVVVVGSVFDRAQGRVPVVLVRYVIRGIALLISYRNAAIYNLEVSV